MKVNNVRKKEDCILQYKIKFMEVCITWMWTVNKLYITKEWKIACSTCCTKCEGCMESNYTKEYQMIVTRIFSVWNAMITTMMTAFKLTHS